MALALFNGPERVRNRRRCWIAGFRDAGRGDMLEGRRGPISQQARMRVLARIGIIRGKTVLLAAPNPLDP